MIMFAWACQFVASYMVYTYSGKVNFDKLRYIRYNHV